MNDKTDTAADDARPEKPAAEPVVPPPSFLERITGGSAAGLSIAGFSAGALAVVFALLIIGYFILLAARFAQKVIQKYNSMVLESLENGMVLEAGVVALVYCVIIAVVCGMAAYLARGAAERRRLQRIPAQKK